MIDCVMKNGNGNRKKDGFIAPAKRALRRVARQLRAEALDKSYLRHWAQELRRTGELERLLSREIKPKNT